MSSSPIKRLRLPSTSPVRTNQVSTPVRTITPALTPTRPIAANFEAEKENSNNISINHNEPPTRPLPEVHLHPIIETGEAELDRKIALVEAEVGELQKLEKDLYMRAIAGRREINRLRNNRLKQDNINQICTDAQYMVRDSLNAIYNSSEDQSKRARAIWEELKPIHRAKFDAWRFELTNKLDIYEAALNKVEKEALHERELHNRTRLEKAEMDRKNMERQAEVPATTENAADEDCVILDPNTEADMSSKTPEPEDEEAQMINTGTTASINGDNDATELDDDEDDDDDEQTSFTPCQAQKLP